MLSLIEVGARYVRVFIELCVLIGILLLLYFLAEVIEFFPPSLTLGDAAKLALVSVVAASVHFITVLANVGVASIGLLVVLFVIKWAVFLSTEKRSFVKDVDSYLSRVWSTGFLQLPVLGLILIWAAVFQILPSWRFTSDPWVLFACAVAFCLMSAPYFSRPEDFQFGASQNDTGGLRLTTGVQLSLIGLGIALVAPVFIWGSFDTFVLVTMTKSGLIQVPADLFLKQEYCGLVQTGFEVSAVSEGFCYLDDVAVMFHGIGDKVLIENFENGFKVTLPAEGVFLSSRG
ncbi:hypothetical protein [Marinobacter sp. DSM 11874]|uniref:hypothetical protein n=1 Tax=Marinobacter nauticus TaxID=2743 RepID=UPI0016159202